MARNTGITVSGWCRTARGIHLEALHSSHSEEYWHGKCHGALERPNGKLWLCECPCHKGQEVKPPSRTATIEARAGRALQRSGKRDADLLTRIADTLHGQGYIEFDAPEDPKQNKSLRERIYTAARKSGMKVKVKNDLAVDGKIRAWRK